MIIITDLKLLPEVVIHAHSITMDISEITIDEVIANLDDEFEGQYHNGRCYCWPNNKPEESVPEEAERVMSYRDMCAEEYEFYSLEPGDVIYFFSEVGVDGGTKIAWHLATFDSIER